MPPTSERQIISQPHTTTQHATVRRTPWAEQHPLLREYYDTEWGLPITDEAGLYERLSLEAFQAGLSWLTVLAKRDQLRQAFAGFAPDRVANFSDADVERILAAPGMIRNRRKIEAIIANARATVALRRTPTPLAQLIWSYIPERTPVPTHVGDIPTSSLESAALASKLKSLGFSFVGPVTVYALMAAIGMVDLHLEQSHMRGCSGMWHADGTLIASRIPRT